MSEQVVLEGATPVEEQVVEQHEAVDEMEEREEVKAALLRGHG